MLLFVGGLKNRFLYTVDLKTWSFNWNLNMTKINSEAYLEPSRISTIEFFSNNS